MIINHAFKTINSKIMRSNSYEISKKMQVQMIRCTLFSKPLQQTYIDAKYQNPCTVKYMKNVASEIKSSFKLNPLPWFPPLLA